MNKLLVTGSSGLIGSEVVEYFGLKGWEIYGIDNSQRADFFGAAGDTRWNQKRLLEKYNNFHHIELDKLGKACFMDITSWIFVILAALNNSLGSLFLKKSRLDVADSSLITMILSPWFIASTLCFGINLLLLAKALEKLPVSSAYPILVGVSFTAIILAGNLIFHEKFSIGQFIGIIMIMAGIIISLRT